MRLILRKDFYNNHIKEYQNNWLGRMNFISTASKNKSREEVYQDVSAFANVYEISVYFVICFVCMMFLKIIDPKI